MAQLKVYGKVAEIYQPRTGETNGNAWSLQDFLIEEPSDKNISVLSATINNYKLSDAEKALIDTSATQGTLLTFSCDVTARKWEHNGKAGYTNNIRVWKVEDGDTRNTTPAPAQRNSTPNVVGGYSQPQQQVQTQAPLQDPTGVVRDELPF